MPDICGVSTNGSRRSSPANPPPSFGPALARLAERIELPVPVKSRILVEMRWDLEALYAHHRARGCSPAVAQRLAEERVIASDDAIAGLVRLHASPLARWLDGLSGRLRRGPEFLVAATVLLGAFGAVGWVAVRLVPPLRPSPALWPVLVLGAACLARAVRDAWRLFVRSSGRAARGRTLPLYLILGAASLFLGAAGVALGLYDTALAAAGGRLTAGDLLVRLGRDAALLAVALAVAFAAGSGWFLFANRASALRRAELAFLDPAGR